MTYKEKILAAKKQDIVIPDILASGKAIVGVYGFFAIKGEIEECFYIGKATDMAGRILGSNNGHVHMYLHNDVTKFVPQKIAEYLATKQGWRIEVRILEEVDYQDTSFSRAAHRLALAELQKIVEYQKKGQCLDQYPEGTHSGAKKYWENYYRKKGGSVQPDPQCVT